MGEMTNTCRILIAKYEGKRPLGKPWRRADHNIKMWFKETSCEGADCIHLDYDRIQ
jgi:hypothetical protein